MQIVEVNNILRQVKAKLESLDPARLAEGMKPLQHNPSKMSGAKKRLANLYGKLTKGRSDATQVQATGAKR